jgi:PAS domain-containing protein
VTEHVLVEELLALQAAVASLPIGVVVGEIPPGGGIRIVAYNDRFREMVGAPPPEGRAVAGVGYRVFKPDRLTELPPDEWPGPKAARLGRAIHGVELHVLRSDGSWRVLLTSAAPVHAGGGGRNPGAVVVALDVTAHADAEPAKS